MNAPLSIAPGSLRAWVLACRPATLTAALSPVLVGAAAAFAAGGFSWLPVLAALFGALMIQIGTNLANDVFDFEKGADTAARLGPTRAVQAGLLSAGQVRAGMVVSFGLATLAGLYLTAVGGWPIVVIGLLSIASGIAYTGGPWPLGYNGLGDVFVFVFFGLVAVCGTAYVGRGEVPLVALLAAVPVGTLATAVLVVNNLRDQSTDVQAGKRTLVVRFGRRFGVSEYAFLVLQAPLFALVLAGVLGSAWPLLGALVTPALWGATRDVAARVGGELNPLLGRTAKLLLAYLALLSLGMALAAP